MAFEFPPTAEAGDYTGDHTAIDEFPPGGGGAGERLQVQRNNGATATATISFDLSTSDEFREVCLLIRDLTSNGSSSGLKRSFQLVVNSVDVGSPIEENITSTIHKSSLIRWPSSVNASVSANPSLVQVRLTMTNQTGVNNVQHHIDTMRMYTSPFSAAQDPWGIASTDYTEAWDALWTQNELALWSDGGAVTTVPALKGGDHMLLNQGTALFEDDGVYPASFIPTNCRWTAQLPANMTDAKFVGVIRTAATLPTGDANSDVAMAGSTWWHVGAGASNNIVLPAIASDEPGTGVSWLHMCGPVGNEADHVRGTTPIASSTEFIYAAVLDSAGNEKLWVCDGGIFADDAVLVLDGQAVSGTNTLRALDWMNRSSGDRPWEGENSALYIFPGDTTEEELFAFAQTIGEAYELLDAEEDPDILDQFGFADETDSAMSFAAASQILDTFGFASETDRAMPFVGVAAMVPPVPLTGQPCRHRREFSRFNRCRCCNCGLVESASS